MAVSTDLLTDAQLTDAVAAQLSPPKADGVTSFTLHAPLELLARTALLPLVEPGARDAARERLAGLGGAYVAAGDGVPEPAPRAYDDLDQDGVHAVHRGAGHEAGHEPARPGEELEERVRPHPAQPRAVRSGRCSAF